MEGQTATTVRSAQSAGRRQSGVVLMEIVLALAVFFAIGGIVVGSMNSAARAAGQVAREARAADLTVTIMSQIHMGLIEARDFGPEYLEEPMDGWTWRIVTEPVSDSFDIPEMVRVEIVVRDTRNDRVHRLTELVLDDVEAVEQEAWW